MGRYGGFELSYGSDADVMFVHEPARRASTRRTRRRTPRPWPTSCAGCWRCPATDPPLEVDADLRPEGKQGPLVRTPRVLRRLLRQVVAGLGGAGAAARRRGRRRRGAARAVRRADRPAALPRRTGSATDDIVEVRRIKARVDDERLPRGADPHTHLKLGRGGLADIEWTVQLLQMQHAGAVPGAAHHRGRSTALEAARRAPSLLEPRGRRDAGRGVAAGEPGAQRDHPGARQAGATSCRATPASGRRSPRARLPAGRRPTRWSTTTCAPPGGRTRSWSGCSGSDGSS